jgi:serine protease Do
MRRFPLAHRAAAFLIAAVAPLTLAQALATTHPTSRPTSITAPATRPTVVAAAATTRAATRPASTRPAPLASSRPVAAIKSVPETVADLRALQARVQAVVAKVAPAVVGLRVGAGQGSGVIISDDGYVLTAGHVASAPGRDVAVLLPSGKSLRAKALGVNYGVDSGLVKINDPNPESKDGKFPVAELGTSATLKRGDYVVVLGHPGGYKASRPAPLRLGRVVGDTRGTFIRTDGTLVGGDSGGPLFDLDGRVIGIHSRIGTSLTDNMHVPVDTYRDTWTRLASGDAWNIPTIGRPGSPYLGLQVDPESPECKIGEIFPNSPALTAGLRAGDVITVFDRQKVANFGELLLHLNKRKAGDEVPVEVLRNNQTVKVKLTIGKRPTQGR